jgi:tRNA A-37 threonylcarbamoyl transferase component Bud32/tetratricopeptide (TPR) repeat protein
MDRSTGTRRLFGRFEIVGLLGEGGMARVYRAVLRGPAGFEKEVALKVLRRLENPEHAEALAKEAKLGAMLCHPHVVDTYELGFHEGQPFIALELVEGLTLRTALRECGDMPVGLALEVAVQVGEGLAHAHGLRHERAPAGIVHRDLKPSNILLSHHGAVKVADFGLARLAQSQTDDSQEHVVQGTSGFMSPEQIQGHALHAGSDIFAFAMVVYQMVTGEPLIPHGSMAQMAAATLSLGHRLAKGDVDACLEGCLPGLAAVLRPCLEVDPTKRPHRLGPVIRELRLLRRKAPEADFLSDWLDPERRTGTSLVAVALGTEGMAVQSGVPAVETPLPVVAGPSGAVGLTAPDPVPRRDAAGWVGLLPWEQMALEQIAIAPAGLSFPVAERLLDLSVHPEAPWAMEVVETLIEKGGLTCAPTGLGAAPRVHVADDLAAQAHARLEGTGELDRLGARFASVLDVAHADALISSTNWISEASLAAVEADMENIKAALEFPAEPEAKARLGLLYLVLARRKLPLIEGLMWADRAMESCETWAEMAQAEGVRASVQVRLLKGLMLMALGKHDQADAVLMAADARARVAGLERLRICILRYRALIEGKRHGTARYLEVARQALDRALEDGDSMLIGECQFATAHALSHSVRPMDGLSHLQEALRLYENVGNVHGMVSCLNMMGELHRGCGRYAQAKEVLAWSTRIGVEAGMVRHAMGLATSRGVLALLMGELDDAMVFLREAQERCLESGNNTILVYASSYMGVCLQLKGELAGAIAAHAIAAASGTNLGLGLDHGFHALAAAERGDVEGAQAQLACLSSAISNAGTQAHRPFEVVVAAGVALCQGADQQAGARQRLADLAREDVAGSWRELRDLHPDEDVRLACRIVDRFG